MTETLSTARASASTLRPAALRLLCAACRRLRFEGRFRQAGATRELFFKTMSSAWSHGTSSSTIVRVPLHLRVQHNVKSADLVNQAEEILQVNILQVDRNRLSCVLRA